MPGDIELASTFSRNCVFWIIAMIAVTRACVVCWRSASVVRAVLICAVQAASFASSAAMKVALDLPTSLTSWSRMA